MMDRIRMGSTRLASAFFVIVTAPASRRLRAFEMVLSKSIEVRDSPVAGKGLFATAPIAAGERVWGPDPDEAAR